MPEENWLDINGKNFFYRDIGKGICTVLIHGIAEDGRIWENQIQFLKNYSRLIIPDLPGAGKSAHDNKDYLIEDYAEVIKAILDKDKISACIMIGHSMGGYITLAFAEKYVERLLSFGLCNSTAYPDSDEKKMVRKKAIEFIQTQGAAEFVRQTTGNLFSGHIKKNHPEIIEKLINKYDNFKNDALVSYYEAMMKRPDRTEVLRNFNHPVLFVIGEDDNAVPLEHSLQQSHIPGFCYIHILKNTGHMAMLESVGEINNFLAGFINNAVL